MDNKMIGNHLWCCRAKKGWTQEFVARQLGISIRTVSRVENGAGISKSLLKRMCSLYRISLSEIYEQKPSVNKISNPVQVDMIPDDVAIKLLCQSSFVNDIQRESILRFNESIQKNALMYREQVEELLPQVIHIKKSYSLAELIQCCMEVNQKTLDNITKIAVA
ncbi:MAG: helix-turn-helix transcriptional regulator [Agathobacter sp.]|nr:helix-turn-helix transcriptional regulator [Agathobacter sp.]